MARTKLTPNFVEKTCPTCGNTFKCPFYVRNKRKFCSRSCANHDPSVLEKMKNSQKETFIKKYGVDHPMKTEGTVNNFKQSMKEKYGVNHALQLPEFMSKSKKTKKEKFGDENYNNHEKLKFTCLKKYGVDNIKKYKPLNDQISLTKKTNHYIFLQSICSDNKIKMISTINDYMGYHFSNSYQFKCDVCDTCFESTVYNLNNLFCPKCNPFRKNSIETELYMFIVDILPGIIITRNDRTILVGKELDIYIPSKKIGIELNGIYWHSEIGGGRNKHYHINKLKNCLFHGVKLIQILETEWLSNQEMVKSILKNHLGIGKNVKTVYARHCTVEEISIKEKNEFLKNNHLQGVDMSTIKIGLKNNGELISVMTFRKSSRFEKNVQWEMTRFCNKTNYRIIGGASKLFSYFIKKYNPICIVSYSDRRYFDGNLYSVLGFQCESNTSPGYFYTSKDYKSIMNRMNFQKHKLKKILPNFDDTKSEWTNMKNNGYDRIWDCGHTKWLWIGK